MDPTAVHKFTASTSKPPVTEPSAQTAASDQVVIGDIPDQRAGLQPRRNLLTKLNQPSQEQSVVVLTGRSGVGKTQLAATYARARLAGGWRLIAWVNARDSQSLLAGLAAVAEATARPADSPPPGAADAGQVVRRWLEADGRRCLLVFDGAEDLSALRPYIPAIGAARILITTTGEPSEKLGTIIPVNIFGPEEAATFLNERTGLADEAGASAVAAELGQLPLVLDQAAATIARQHLEYATYLAELRALPAEGQLAKQESGEVQPYPPGVAEAVLLSLRAVRAADPLGVCRAVMEVMSMVGSASVRRDLLRAAGQEGALLGGGRRVAASMVDQALEGLKQRSLLGFSQDGQAVSLHHLIARVTRDRMAQQGRLASACRLATSVLERSTDALAMPRDHAAAREFPAQITALFNNAQEHPADVDEELTSTLLRLRLQALRHLVELGDSMPQAVAIGEPLAVDLDRILGPGHPDTLNACNSLALAYRAVGRTAEAIPLLRQILAAREWWLGADHSSTLTARNNLAMAYRATNRPAEAIPLFEVNVAACERLLGAHHLRTLASQRNLDRARQESARAVSEAHDVAEDD